MTDVRVVADSFPGVIAVPESKAPGVALAVLADIIAGGMPGVGVKNTKGSAFAYQGFGFFYNARVFVGDQPQRRLAFCNRFGVNPEPDLLVRPVIGRWQQRIIAIVKMRIVRPRFEAGIPRQTASRSKMDVVGAKPFLRELNGIAIYRSVVEYRFGKREETTSPA